MAAISATITNKPADACSFFTWTLRLDPRNKLRGYADFFFSYSFRKTSVLNVAN